MKAWQFERSLHPDNQRRASDRELAKALNAPPWEEEPVMVRQAPRQASRFADDPDPRQFAHVADPLLDPHPGQRRPGATLETLAKAMPPAATAKPQFNEGIARASLSKAISDGQCSAREAAKAEGMINRLAMGQRIEVVNTLAKAMHPTHVDPAELARARRLYDEARASGRLTGRPAADMEARLLRYAA